MQVLLAFVDDWTIVLELSFNQGSIMFDWVRDIFDNLAAERRRRANLRLFGSLSDDVLRDIGLEPGRVEAGFTSLRSRSRPRRDNDTVRSRQATRLLRG
ncbi:DUF1127 domain-containing protein [Trinickia symbiotica]|uniref:DUF1127 domain-containing protein n=3 Tax=Trinickia symbiotica TaxID=863227 RepID=A0A2N7X9M7_9BURK|nr:DUF1127 domain-containing protein [Trinickia symbiotica]